MRKHKHHKTTGLRPRSRWLAFASAALTAALVTQVYALGLGKLEVKSALDEPLHAEIEIQPGAPGELETLSVSLGSAADFARARVARSDQLEGLEFSVTGNPAAPVIVVTTTQPYSEPYLHFLLLAQWSGGKMVREYTALLNPPLYVAELPAGTHTTRAARAVQPAPPSEPVVVTPIAEKPEPHAGRLSEVRRFGEYGPTSPGDTLWNIALDLRDSGTQLDLFQIMSALFEENPAAFVGGNMHRLKVGQTLRLADLDAVARIPRDGARLLYDTHLAEWNRALGVMMPALPDSDAAVPAKPATASAATTDLPVSPILVYKGLAERVEIIENRVVRNSERLSELEATLALVQASLARDMVRVEPKPTASGAVTPDAQALPAAEPPAVAPAEAVVKADNSPLVPVADVSQDNAPPVAQAPPAAEQSAATAQTTVKADKSPLAPVVDVSQDSALPPAANGAATDTMTPSAADTGVSSSLVSAISELGPMNEGNSSAVEPRPPETAAVTAPSATQVGEGSVTQIVNAAMQGRSEALERADMQPPVPVVNSDDTPRASTEFGWREFSESVSLGFNWFTAGVAGAVLLLIGLLFFMRQRRLAMDFQQSVFLDQKAAPAAASEDDSVTVATDDIAVRTGTFASTLRDFEIPGMVSVQTDKVDALAEAEIYMAYGRDEQAEGVLKEALSENPDRSEFKLKLLEIYHKRKDVAAFEALAEEFYASAGQQEPVLWQKVAALGSDLNPNNLLFARDDETSDSTAAVHSTAEPELPSDVASAPAPKIDVDGADAGTGAVAAAPSFAEPETGITEDDAPEPLAQADLYLAYGHVDQALRILQDVLAEDPADRQVKRKLLEIHAQRQDTEAFEQLAADLLADADADDRSHVDSLRETLPVAATDGQPDADQQFVVEQTPDEFAGEQPPSTDFDLGLGDLVEEAAVVAQADASTDVGSDVVDETEFLRDRISSLENELASREQENRELQDRLDTLQGQTRGIIASADDDIGSIDFDDQIEIDEPAVGMLHSDHTGDADESQLEALQRQVAALEEALRTRDNENQSLRDRIESLERKVGEIMEQLREIGIDIDSTEDIRSQALKLREIGGAG